MHKVVLRNNLTVCYKCFVRYSRSKWGLVDEGTASYEVPKETQTLEEQSQDEEMISRPDALYEKYVGEELRKKEFASYKTIVQNYFKQEKEPSLLTWSTKEQIRHLHKSEPDYWTPELLAKSFPASLQTIKKLLKSKLRLDKEQALRHDLRVAENWKILYGKQGGPIKAALIQTYLKNNAGMSADVKEIAPYKPRKGVFLKTFEQYDKLKNNEKIIKDPMDHIAKVAHIHNPDESPEARNSQMHSQKEMTLEKLKEIWKINSSNTSTFRKYLEQSESSPSENSNDFEREKMKENAKCATIKFPSKYKAKSVSDKTINKNKD